MELSDSSIQIIQNPQTGKIYNIQSRSGRKLVKRLGSNMIQTRSRPLSGGTEKGSPITVEAIDINKSPSIDSPSTSKITESTSCLSDSICVQLLSDDDKVEKVISIKLDTLPFDQGIDKVMEIVNDKQLWKEGQKPLFDKWKETYSVENVYNRAIIFNGRQFHCSHGGFGKNIEESRLFQTFFFSPIKI